MRYPEFLQDNGSVGFIAPSFGCADGIYRWRFDKAVENLQNCGYKTVLGPNAYASNGTGISNTPKKCAEEANDFLTNDRSDVVISCGGGELMCEILPYIDFEGIAKAAPKWFMGFSDNTNLTFLLNTLCDTASIYGPNAGNYMSKESALEAYRFIMSRSGKSVEEIDELANTMHLMARDGFDLISGKKLAFENYENWYEEYKITNPENSSEDVKEGNTICGTEDGEQNEIRYSDFTTHNHKHFLYCGDKEVPEVSFEGRMVGGCLDCLSNLVGTRFDKVSDFAKRYKEDGIIWFLESCELNVMSQARSYWSLDNAGWFENVKAFVIGRPMMFDDTFDEFDHYKAAIHALSKFNVPIILDADIGHLSPMMPIVSGAYASVRADANKLKIEYELR